LPRRTRAAGNPASAGDYAKRKQERRLQPPELEARRIGSRFIRPAAVSTFGAPVTLFLHVPHGASEVGSNHTPRGQRLGAGQHESERNRCYW